MNVPKIHSRVTSKGTKQIKGELNPKIKLDLNDSFRTLINKYITLIYSNFACFKRNFQISKSFTY